MISSGNFYKNRIGEVIQVIYWDRRASVYGVLKETHTISLNIEPASHMPFVKINSRLTPDFESLRKRLNTSGEISTEMMGIRDITFFKDGGIENFGYDIREAPNISKPIML